ncbi:hypothetical protein CDD83_9962 [Cordyceps sp. RAO-2017]|nr:hypothetical protein CDD83_9962 [Cordyceps sp. RAO-2017]
MAQNSTVDRLAALDTNRVSEALDVLGLKGAVYGLRPLWKCPNIVGRVSTARVCLEPGDAAPTPGPASGEAAAEDRVLVISGGIDGVSCADAIVDKARQSKRVRGVVIDGVHRDVDGAHKDGFPVCGLGLASVSERGQAMQVESGKPLEIRGVTVCQDDYVTADSAGTVFVAAQHMEQVLDVAERISCRQRLMAQAIEAGRPASEVINDPQFKAIGPKDAAASSQPKKATGEDQELVALFADVDTAAVSDALDKLGMAGQALGIMPLENYQQVTVGPAFTVRYVPAGQPAGSVGNFIDDVGPGDVVVIDNRGRTDCTVWGDIMTQYAGLRGIAGSVIDGVCRDVTRAIGDHYPLFTAGRWMRTGKDRVEVGAVNEPVGIGGAHVKPRDIVVADANGVVFVPRDRAREVAEVARWIEKNEAGIREMIVDGATLSKAREVFKYHQLQRTG